MKSDFRNKVDIMKENDFVCKYLGTFSLSYFRGQNGLHYRSKKY